MTKTATRVAGIGVLLLTGCGAEQAVEARQEAQAAGSRPVVATVNYPLAYLAERIGGEAVEVRFDAPPDVDPAHWQPGADEIVALQSADLLLLNGAGYAGWLRTAALPSAIQVDTSAGFRDRLVERADRITHTHGPEGEHSHAGTAYTTWLDQRLAILQAAAVRDALAARLPARREELDARYEELERELQALDARLAAAVAQDPRRAVVFSHPVYQYLVERYRLNGHSLHWEPDEEPTTEQWAELEALVSEHGAHVLLWEGEPLAATVAGLEERGVASFVFAPCGNRPESGDLMSVMAANAQALERAFGSTD